MGDDKRLNIRSDLNVKLVLEIIDNGVQRPMDPFEVTITDVSIGGIGFTSDNQLMIGEIFKGNLTLWTKQKFDFVAKIVRCKVEREGYSYGCTFVGMSDSESVGIRIYQMFNEKK